jgi:two-component system NtrC family sensor kinase
MDKLLKYSRASPSTLNLQMVDVNKLIEDTILLVRHEAERKQANIVTGFDVRCRVKIDAQELQQVLINLLINAIHAIGQHGKIEISTHQLKDGDVSILISDNGEGIDFDDIDKIFDPFYSTKHSQGTGLGLSVSYGLVNRYGGSLEVSSTPGEGSVFCVQLRREPKMSPQMHALFDLYSHDKAVRGGAYYE